ncbi:homeobox-leucine zipper protein HDG11-like [Gastrolobium bilobum]|uniref:homeobox-leucine zipper protein HDG11-like n=1 Tax=Gastrolobium bilobum TaxID=150636 RepID=UPI002AB0503B|nr:homeobox-leucine zipper protein HDG11-like [Gastrolobium bilobum]
MVGVGMSIRIFLLVSPTSRSGLELDRIILLRLVDTLNERADNNALRAENERINNENLALREALKKIICPSCGGPPCGDEHAIKHLQLQNARLKEQHEKVSIFLARFIQKPISHPELQLAPPSAGSSYDLSLGSTPKLSVDGSFLNLGVGSTSLSFSDEDMLPHETNEREELEKALMFEIAISAKEELLKLLDTNEPIWVKSSTDRRYMLHPETYEMVFPLGSHFKTSTARVESSKDSRIVRIKPMQLIDMFLDSEKWINLFPTIISKAHTIKVFESGMSENRSGALQLMYEEMHVLSPIVPSREFYFLRYCHQVEAGIWVIVDVSFDYLKEEDDPFNPLSRSWRFPSGCMIHKIADGSTQVTWVEHVELDEKFQTHRLYRDLVNKSIAYGAERWLMELQRMCERLTSAAAEYVPSYDSGVVTIPEGRRSVIKLAHRMVKNFCEILNMSSKMDFPQHLTEESNSGVRIAVRKNTDPNGLPNGMLVVTAASSFWLPFPSQILFDFFKDARERIKWDNLCSGYSMHEISHISNGTHPNNYVAIIRSLNPNANNVFLLQECFIDPLGAYVIYAPVKVPDINLAVNGGDSSMVSILPSGIVISEDAPSIINARASSSSGNSGKGSPRGSLVTVAFQILMPNPAVVNMESVAGVNAIITSTVQNIKDALIKDSD